MEKPFRKGEDSVKLETYGPSGCVGLFEEALKDNELEYNKKTIPLPFNYSIYKWAATTRKMLNNVQLPEGIEFYNIYGTSFDTPFDVCYGSETDPINDPSEICHTLLGHHLLAVAVRFIQKDAEEKKTSFNPRPYFWLFIDWLLDLSTLDLLAEISQSPSILSEVDAALKVKQMKNDVDEYLKANNAVVRTWGEKRTEPKLKNHVELVELLGIADLKRGANVAGGRGFYLKGDGVRLNDVAAKKYDLEAWFPNRQDFGSGGGGGGACSEITSVSNNIVLSTLES